MSQPDTSPHPTSSQDAPVETPPQDARPTTLPQPAGQPVQHHRHGHSHGHGWMMWLMCLPMVLIVGYLLITGAVGGGAIIYALGCVMMMGVMMRLMNHGSGGSGPST
jgi:hypothetical protein